MDDHIHLTTNPPFNRPPKGAIALYYDMDTNRIRAWDSELNEIQFGSPQLSPPEGQSFLLTGTTDGRVPGPFDDDAHARDSGIPVGYLYQNSGQVYIVGEP